MARYGVTSKYYKETFDTTTKTYVFVRNVIQRILTKRFSQSEQRHLSIDHNYFIFKRLKQDVFRFSKRDISDFLNI